LAEIKEPGAHAEKLVLLVDEVFEKAGLIFGDLDAVAVSQGPGSYTGLRIGVSTAKGIAYGLDIPLIGINTLQAMASGGICGCRFGCTPKGSVHANLRGFSSRNQLD
jgi:tRNA threonylcarbamoyladenosine biosynthesis protein TsaB